MLIAILSDIHDNLANLKKCLDWCRKNKVQKMIFCGDTTTIETVNYLAAHFSGEIFMVRGNIELYEPDDMVWPSNLSYRGEYGRLEIDGLNIGFCHEPDKIKKVMAMEPTPLSFVFYGHTHKPWWEKRGETVLANPGTVAGTFNQATFATLDTETKKLELRILADI